MHCEGLTWQPIIVWRAFAWLLIFHTMGMQTDIMARYIVPQSDTEGVTHHTTNDGTRHTKMAPLIRHSLQQQQESSVFVMLWGNICVVCHVCSAEYKKKPPDAVVTGDDHVRLTRWERHT